MSRPFLVAVETTVPWEVFSKLSLAEARNVVKPVQVRHDGCEASHCAALQFHVVRRKESHCFFYLTVNVSGLEANRADLLLEVSLTRTPYSQHSSSDTDMDRSAWPIPDKTIVTRHAVSGEVGAVRITQTRCLTVRAMLYGPQPSVPASPLAVKLNDARRSGTMCDVVFVADGYEFHAHKSVVSARSAVFHSMFSSTFLEARDGRAVIEGVSANVFDKFLEFLYLDHISDWGELELELLQLADRYMVDHLQDACQLRLWQVGGVRALQLLRLVAEAPTRPPASPAATGEAHQLGPQRYPGLAVPSPMRRRAIRIVVDNWPSIVGTPEWKSFEAACPVVADVILACTTSQAVEVYQPKAKSV